MRITFTIILLIISNVVMTYAWYGTLRKPGEEVAHTEWWKLILISWGVAFFEYCFMIPGNHIGRSAGLSLAQLKIMQEVITLSVFVPFMLFFMGENWKWDYLWAFLCVLGAVFFVNREALMAS
ncbi:MAG: DMT family protein [Akkermansia sp.]|nr:DMT family protein [Akkermansia sp.]